MYIFHWNTSGLIPSDPGYIDSTKTTAINVAVNSSDNTSTSLTLTGKGASNYGVAQQTNQLRLLENFAGPTAPPTATVGQTWFDSTSSVLKVLVDRLPTPVWRPLQGAVITEVGEPAPSPAALGDLWFQRTGTSSGILHVFTGVGRFGDTPVGGWDQVWPSADIAGGREEYDYVLSLLNTLALEAGAITSGSGAIGTYLDYLPDLPALDALMLAALTSRGADDNVLYATDLGAVLKVQPTSQDWDHLLAACRYTINRLELPPGAALDISSFPFVQDGRQAPADLLAKTTVEYPQEPDRLALRRIGLISLVGLYSETVNMLNVAITNRFSIKGINGGSGTNTALDVTTTPHSIATVTKVMGPGGTLGETLAFTYRFADASALNRFIGAAGVFEFAFTHTGGAGAADTNMGQLAANNALIRVTGDRTRSLNSNPSPLVTQVATNGVTSASGTTLITITGTDTSLNIVMTRTANTVTFTITVVAGGSTTGSTAFNLRTLEFTDTYGLGLVYPVANAYTAGDATGTFPTGGSVTI